MEKVKCATCGVIYDPADPPPCGRGPNGPVGFDAAAVRFAKCVLGLGPVKPPPDDPEMPFTEMLKRRAKAIEITDPVSSLLLWHAADKLWDASHWQPIETAPSDCTAVLALHVGNVIRTGHQMRVCWRQEVGSDYYVSIGTPDLPFKPTHWMPLPPPPPREDRP